MSLPRTVVIMGAPGAGKSTIGRLLAARLGVPHIEVDDRIEAQEDKPIREIFADSGEAYFRDLERVATIKALAEPGVVSLGGGAVMTPAVAEALTGLPVVWLKVSVANATRRIGMTTARPLLLSNVRATLSKLLAERTAVYEAVATIAVDTDRLSSKQVVDRIEQAMRESVG